MTMMRRSAPLSPPPRFASTPFLVAALLAGLAGCGDGLAASPDAGTDAAVDGGEPGPDASVEPYRVFHGGTRLALELFTTGDGLRTPAGFHDRERDESCAFTHTAEGIRCLPDSRFVSEFADADCTAPLYHATDAACVSPPPYFALYFSTPCLSHTQKLWASGATTVPTEIYRFDITTGDCVGPEAPSPGGTWFAAGDEVPLTAFVGATLAQSAGDQRVRTVLLGGDDGSQRPFGFVDSDLSTSCFIDAVGADYYCFPPAAATGYFGDDACGTPIVGQYCPQSTAFSDYAIERSTGVCNPTVEVYALGDAIEPAEVYGLGGDTCYSLGVDPSIRYFSRGAALPVTTLAAISRVRDQRAGRIDSYRFTAADGFVAWSASLHDDGRSGDCAVLLAADGEERCLPTGTAAISDFFADAACTEALPLAVQRVDGCDRPAPPAGHRIEQVGCDRRQHVFALGDVVTPAALYRRNSSGTCSQTAVDPVANRYFAVGAEIAASDFDGFTRVTEE